MPKALPTYEAVIGRLGELGLSRDEVELILRQRLYNQTGNVEKDYWYWFGERWNLFKRLADLSIGLWSIRADAAPVEKDETLLSRLTELGEAVDRLENDWIERLRNDLKEGAFPSGLPTRTLESQRPTGEVAKFIHVAPAAKNNATVAELFRLMGLNWQEIGVLMVDFRDGDKMFWPNEVRDTDEARDKLVRDKIRSMSNQKTNRKRSGRDSTGD